MLGCDNSRELSYSDSISNVEAMSRHANTVTLNHLRRAFHPGFVDVSECEITAPARQ